MMPRQTKTWTALSLACVAVLALGGCKGDSSDQQEAAGGEILPRSVTDDMPPYDTVRSRPPLADPEAAASAAVTVGTPISDSSEAAQEAAEEVIAADAVEPPARALPDRSGSP